MAAAKKDQEAKETQGHSFGEQRKAAAQQR